MVVKHARGAIEFVLEQDFAETPHLMGSWDEWRFPGTPMSLEAGEPQRWRALLKLPPGEHLFRYRIGGNWFNDPRADGYIENGMGDHNSIVVVEALKKGRGRLSARASPKKAASPRRPQRS